MRLIVAGGGLAGLVAAVRAAGLGARVILLEKGESTGGSLLHSSGYLWSYNDLDTFREQAPGGDPTLQSLLLNRLGEALGWMESLGAPVICRKTGNPLTSGARLGPRGLFEALMKRLEESGAEVRTGSALSELLHEDGRVTGALLSSGDDEPADAVVLATGGFGANRELVGCYVTEGPCELRLRANPRGTGDGLLAAQRLGARKSVGMDEFYGRNLPAPPAEFGPEHWVEASQLYGRYAVAINSNGERYADESADWSETRLTQATARQPGLRVWYVRP
jgi:tricarballylate dehydrogenase